MEYPELLEKLYNGSINDILKVLDTSVYVSDFNKNDEIVLDTGFIFNTHKGSQMAIYFSLASKAIIRVPGKHLQIKRLNGSVLADKKGVYFSGYLRQIFMEFHEPETWWYNILKTDLQEYYHEKESKYPIEKVITYDEKNIEEVYSKFKVVCSDGKIKEFPLQKELKEPIFYNGVRFSKYLSDYEFERQLQEENEYDENTERPQSAEDWYRSEFGDDAGWAWNNTH